jgi:hypothetical protein
MAALGTDLRSRHRPLDRRMSDRAASLQVLAESHRLQVMQY